MRQFHALLISLALGLGLGGTTARAEGPVVVELYTSQGCSSCPPADRLLRDLSLRSDVIAIALHVDYWDYIGWADSFADPRFTRRQKAYARAAGHGTVYTPQFVVNGTDHVVGTRPEELVASIANQHDRPHPVVLEAERHGGALRIHAVAEAPGHGFLVQLVRIDPGHTVEITRGENAGHTLTYSRIATDWEVLAEWSGEAPLEIETAIAGDASAVVIVQSLGMGAIAAALELPVD